MPVDGRRSGKQGFDFTRRLATGDDSNFGPSGLPIACTSGALLNISLDWSIEDWRRQRP